MRPEGTIHFELDNCEEDATRGSNPNARTKGSIEIIQSQKKKIHRKIW
jgi:hypothetical protein